VIGIGGLGHLALQFARAMGCEVTAFSRSPDKEPEARSFGAHRFVATREKNALRSAVGTLDFVLPAFALIGGQKAIAGSVIGGRKDIREMLEFAARHGVAAKTELRPLSEADAGLAHVRAGRARYRVVLTA
jgi:uncharacterized zinc-type alcohol dehydrogenase-like protein